MIIIEFDIFDMMISIVIFYFLPYLMVEKIKYNEGRTPKVIFIDKYNQVYSWFSRSSTNDLITNQQKHHLNHGRSFTLNLCFINHGRIASI